MHQLLQSALVNQGAGAYGKVEIQSSIQLSDIISLSSFEIVKHLKIPLPLYVILITIEIAYMISFPAEKIVTGQSTITTFIFEQLTATGAYIIAIGTAVMLVLQLLFILWRGTTLKRQQSEGADKQTLKQEEGANQSFQNQQGTLELFLVKFSGIFLTLSSSCLSQLLLRLYTESFSCDLDYEIIEGCDSTLRQATVYFSVIGLISLICTSLFSDIFITKLFPDKEIPWASWNENSRLMRNMYKVVIIISSVLISDSYSDIMNFVSFAISFYMIYERYMKPSAYSRSMQIILVFYESQIFVFSMMSFFVGLSQHHMNYFTMVYIFLVGVLMGIFLIYAIDKKEQDIISVGSEMKNYRSLFQIELYAVVMLHELERLILNEEYGQEKHIHAVISRHMEECQNDSCQCKNYEPEYDKKFTTIGSKRLSKAFSGGGSLGPMGSASLTDLKRLPYKITYKTKVEIFKQEFEVRIDNFLTHYQKSYGIKLLKSFFNHKYCDSSYKALFVQLENSITCKNFKGKIFIYHLKTQIQDEMKKSLESPLTININQLLRFEKFKMDFEKNLEDLGYHCQTFWTDLIKEEYNVSQILKTAYNVADRIMDIKYLFSKLININQLCIDTSSTYALSYRYILRDEATFSELINRIQQIKNSSKLEQMREQGVKFFDSDIYSLLMVSGDINELGRIKQANSQTRFVFGYDPKDLIGSRINKLMPGPFAQIHDKFLGLFLNKGKSNFLERNQCLPVIVKDGYLQMTLFYIKPMVSLHFGLVFSAFTKLLNKYTVALDSQEYQKISKLCYILTDKDGYVHGMSESCSKQLGLPPPSARKQLSINENQLLNIQQICKSVMEQEFEFELVRGIKMTVDTTFLNKERQFRREYPDIACKIGVYQAEVGVHKYSYRDMKSEINIFVIKPDEKDAIRTQNANDLDDSQQSKSVDEDLTYSEFSITTANSSVVSQGMATSKFKTFKQKIQSMSKPSSIIMFQRLSFLTFTLLLGIAAGNFVINLIQNHSYINNLDLLNNLQVLAQQIPEAAHSVRELLLISNNLVQTPNDDIIDDYSTSKFAYYAKALEKSSYKFEEIQNTLKTIYTDSVEFDRYYLYSKQIQTDGSIRSSKSSMQTLLNLYSSKILKFSTYNQTIYKNLKVPNVTFDWNDYIQLLNKQGKPLSVSPLQQELYFVLENGLTSLIIGIEELLQNTQQQIEDDSSTSATISIVLACISIFLVIVLLPMCWPTLTHIEKISKFILMSLNRLPEVFCQNETKACMELIMFLNEQKEGEKSTHQMIKKHDHRKQNRQILKLPKTFGKINMNGDGTNSSISSYESDSSDIDRSTLLQSTRFRKSGYGQESVASIDSRASRVSAGTNGTNTNSVTSSKITQLSRLKASTNQYEAQQPQQLQRVKRGQGGAIELEFAHAKTSELLDDIDPEDQNAELTETEIKQREREKARKLALKTSFARKKLKKFGCLILTALIIAIYFGISSFYLNLVHTYERVYLEDYSLIGKRIQCYSNIATYTMDTIARNSNISLPYTDDAAAYFLDDCFTQEQRFKQMLLDGLTVYKNIDTFNGMSEQFESSTFCEYVCSKKNLKVEQCHQVNNGILNNGLTETLYLLLRNLQSNKLIYDNRISYTAQSDQITLIKDLLMRNNSNQLISLHEVYLRAAFEIMREQSLSIIDGYFSKLNKYYNMLFGIFVGLLSLGQTIVILILVKKLSKEIIKMYHVVLMIPFSGRTQNDLNRLMMIKL